MLIERDATPEAGIPRSKKTNDKFLRLSRALWLTLTPSILTGAIGAVVLLLCRMPPVGYLWALAWISAGTLLGVIFGIPRAGSEKTGIHSGEIGSANGMRANTNVEQVSDWLTKLLIGLGLIELKEIPHYLSTCAQVVASSLSKSPDSVQFSLAVALILFCGVQGILGGFLITRVVFQIFFHLSDEAIRDKHSA